jgi:hypothetical protein
MFLKETISREMSVDKDYKLAIKVTSRHKDCKRKGKRKSLVNIKKNL